MKLSGIQEIGRPVAYYPRIAEFLGSIQAAIFLCQLLYWEGKQWDKEGWIFKTVDQMHEETGLTRYPQETARKVLRSRGYVQEKIKGIPGKLHYKINRDRLNAGWKEWLRENPIASLGKNHKQRCKKTANSTEAIPHPITESTDRENIKENTGEDIILSRPHFLGNVSATPPPWRREGKP